MNLLGDRLRRVFNWKWRRRVARNKRGVNLRVSDFIQSLHSLGLCEHRDHNIRKVITASAHITQEAALFGTLSSRLADEIDERIDTHGFR